MPFVPAPLLAEVQFRTTLSGEQTMNRIHVDMLEAPDATNLAELALTCADVWTGNISAITPPELVLREVYVKSLAEQPGPEATFSATLPAAGTLGQPPLPNNVTIAVSLRSGNTGRSARGRWYWQGLTEGQVTGNQVADGTQNAIDAALTNLRLAIAGIDRQWVIASFFSGGGPRPGGPVYFPVTDILLVDGVIDSQRRRLPGRGR